MSLRPLLLLPFLSLLAGCPPEEAPECQDFDQVFAWEDADGDGFGAHVAIGWVCALGPNQSSNDGDCDDTLDTAFPNGVEVCDLVDNDCDGFADEDSELVPWYPDEDGDGFGDEETLRMACLQPGLGWTRTPGDCDDVRADVGPAMPEICNDGVDDDCDGDADDADVGIDQATWKRWYRDQDGDDYGDMYEFLDKCVGPASATLDGQDCDDLDPLKNPDATEVCNREDDDCDLLVDDEDPNVDPAGQTMHIADDDNDGFGSPTEMSLQCDGPPFDNKLDCDDQDPLANMSQDWFVDEDGDGSGAGPAEASQCVNPGGGLAPERNGIDCAPNNPDVFPDQIEDCFDGRDQDCDARVDCEDPDCSTVPTCLPPCADLVWTPTNLPATRTGNTNGEGNEHSAPCGGGGAADVAYWFTPPSDGNYTFDTIGSGYDTVLMVFDACGGAVLACNDDAVGFDSRVNVNNLQAGVPVLVVVDGYSSQSGNYDLHAEN